jgi:hypothetical protein
MAGDKDKKDKPDPPKGMTAKVKLKNVTGPVRVSVTPVKKSQPRGNIIGG